jgi:hypothetical protein
LADINERVEEAIQHLGMQQSLASGIDCPRIHQALLLLLSNGLRIYFWLKRQRHNQPDVQRH